jgi:hypothetical protein
MSEIPTEEKKVEILKKYNTNPLKQQTKRINTEKDEIVICKYKNLPPDLNSISLKARFTCQKMIHLMDNNKEEELTLDEFNDPKKAKIFKEKLNRKLIQYYCMENMEKNKFKAPSERTINKLQQFKKWQNYEIFQKDGIKNYLNNILPDYRLIKKTNFLINQKINIYNKFKIKKNPETILLPKLEITNQKNNNIKETELNNDQSKSYILTGDKYNDKKRLVGSKSLDEFKLHSSVISRMLNQNALKSKSKNKKTKNKFLTSNKSIYSINFLKNTKNSPNNKSLNNIKDEIKNFEESTFCYSKVKIPSSVNKSITSSKYGGCIYHKSSLLRSKNMNDLLNSPSQDNIFGKLDEYKIKRNKIISNKDYLEHIGKTFVTINKQLTDYDYNIF